MLSVSKDVLLRAQGGNAAVFHDEIGVFTTDDQKALLQMHAGSPKDFDLNAVFDREENTIKSRPAPPKSKHPTSENENKSKVQFAPTKQDMKNTQKDSTSNTSATNNTNNNTESGEPKSILKLNVNAGSQARDHTQHDFHKEDIKPAVKYTSTLTSSILTSVISQNEERDTFADDLYDVKNDHRNGGQKGDAGNGNNGSTRLRVRTITVFFTPPQLQEGDTATVDDIPTPVRRRITVRGKCSVSGFIETAVGQWNSPLSIDSDNESEETDAEGDGAVELPSSDTADYEVRMTEDDEGEPDMDLPPFDKNANVFSVLQGVDAVCLVFTNLAKLNPKNKKRMSMLLNAKNTQSKASTFLKVFMGNDSTILKVDSSLSLLELMPIVQKKKRLEEKVGPEKYEWFYCDKRKSVSSKNDATTNTTTSSTTSTSSSSSSSSSGKFDLGEPLDVHILVRELLNDSLQLKRKVPKALMGDVKVNSKSTPNGDYGDFVFSKKDFEQLTYYNVIKTNERGRQQHRKLGIDAKAIYNHTDQRTGIMGKFGGPLITERKIESVVSCQRLPNTQQKFVIQFREKNGQNFSREYETETKMDCLHIVAKLNFLIKNHATMK